jgi:dihydroflavonol-4-reductase
MNVFLTGATGFVGGNLLRQLADSGARVKALAQKGGDRRNLVGVDFDLVEGSVTDETVMARAMQGCDWVFHVAARYSLLRRDRAEIYASNVDGTRSVLRAAKMAGVKRIVHTSSVAAIGVPPENAVADEALQTTLVQLVSDYKKSKFLAEALARDAAKDGLPVVIVNPSTPVGPYDVKPTPTGDIVLRFLRRRMPAYVRTGLNLIDVRDVAQGHILAAERGAVGERYILGNRNVSLKEMLDILARLTGLPAPTRALPHWLPIAVGAVDEFVLSPLLRRPPTVAFDSARMAKHPMYYDSGKAVARLGLPQTPIETALKDAVEWFQANGYVS